MSKQIYITGNIGVGKTTTAEILSDKIGWDILQETVDNHPTLIAYYDALESRNGLNMAYQALRTQLWFAKDRTLKQFYCNDNVIVDRCLAEDLLFAKQLVNNDIMDTIDFEQIYLPYYNMFSNLVPPCHKHIHLRAPISHLLERIKDRGRACEKNITYDYLHGLQLQYDEWIANSKDDIMIINTENVNMCNAAHPIYDQIVEFLNEC